MTTHALRPPLVTRARTTARGPQWPSGDGGSRLSSNHSLPDLRTTKKEKATRTMGDAKPAFGDTRRCRVDTSRKPAGPLIMVLRPDADRYAQVQSVRRDHQRCGSSEVPFGPKTVISPMICRVGRPKCFSVLPLDVAARREVGSRVGAWQDPVVPAYQEQGRFQ